MFKPATLLVIAIICLVLSVLGFGYWMYVLYPSKDWRDYFTPVSSLLMALASYQAIKAVRRHQYANNFKVIGWYIYVILVLVVLFAVVNLSVGLFPGFFLAFGLINKNRDIDENMKLDKDR
ncbi:hypothetical protein [Mucilaginibacter glaciei]|uniref:Uncharacterized protein n=1 Tax=Mucilaginibacter glaciei TaxID=2772109 RepID=A0A926NNQ3_9SPHI|nr:hypothetical protein [Mucilaginibacter glaciei]MBD1394536.1 hypothetical protein [Mucilaginibacter glaciei]